MYSINLLSLAFNLESFLLTKVDFPATKDRKTQYLDKAYYQRSKPDIDPEAPSERLDTNSQALEKEAEEKLRAGNLRLEDYLRVYN